MLYSEFGQRRIKVAWVPWLEFRKGPFLLHYILFFFTNFGNREPPKCWGPLAAAQSVLPPLNPPLSLAHNSALYPIHAGVEKRWSKDTYLPHFRIHRKETGHASPILHNYQSRSTGQLVDHSFISKSREDAEDPRVPYDALNQTLSWNRHRLQLSLVEIDFGAPTVHEALGYGQLLTYQA